MIKKFKTLSPAVKIYFLIMIFTALSQGLSGGVLSNYFKDAYNVTAFQRGFIEFPRELPGVLTIFVISLLAGFSDIKIAQISSLFAIFGILVLAFFTPSFNIMLVFIFINSLGQHMSMPLRNSIGIHLVKENYGKSVGQYKGVYTAFTMVASLIVFIGFKFGFFSFKTPLKLVFVLAAIMMCIVFILYHMLEKNMEEVSHKKIKFIVRKEYKYYYFLTILYGVQKQIMLVFGPWVLISLLNKGAATISMLKIIGALIGIFFIPFVGRMLDKYGVKKLLYADGLSFVLVYLLYAFVSKYFLVHEVSTGLFVFIAYGVFIIDRMSNQMGLVRDLYLRSILVKEEDLRPTLSLGLSLDHVVSITCAVFAGFLWDKFGPQYIFLMTAIISLMNVFIAKKVEVVDEN